MKNKAIDMHNILFETLERLNDTDINGEDLTTEIKRADAINKTASQIISNARLVLDAERMKNEYGDMDLPDMLTANNVDAKLIEKPKGTARRE